jgi:mannosyl-3-phosphoglycerate phosphatase family protein
MNKLESPRLIIFTDLDGTLLDLSSYSFHSASEALSRIKETETPLIFCSSKTRAEQQYYQQKMGIRAPFIVENGAAIFIPEGYFPFAYDYERRARGYQIIELGVSSALIQQVLQAVREEAQLSFRGYADLSIAELCRLTGLDPKAANRARQREYSETLVEISKLAAERLNRRLFPVGFSCTWGSRFCTVAAAQVDKGTAVERLANLFAKQCGDVKTVGLGDGANDASLLEAVDEAFLVQKPDKSWEPIDVPQVKPVEGIGPTGWNRSVCHLLREYLRSDLP